MEEEYKLGNTTQEFEELFGNVPFEDIDKIKKWLFNNYIPISVIQNKIDEYREKRNKLADGHFWDKASNINEDRSLFIATETLKLLLEERNK